MPAFNKKEEYFYFLIEFEFYKIKKSVEQFSDNVDDETKVKFFIKNNFQRVKQIAKKHILYQENWMTPNSLKNQIEILYRI